MPSLFFILLLFSMRKFLILIVLALYSFSASAFDFDGISLNLPYIKVAQEISKRGYAYDSDKNCLTGNCQGTEIYLYINYLDVKKPRMVGQLIVEIPMTNNKQSLEDATTLFNVVYHQVSKSNSSVTYEVDKDGTQLVVSQKGSSIFLTYNTPFYKAPQS